MISSTRSGRSLVIPLFGASVQSSNSSNLPARLGCMVMTEQAATIKSKSAYPNTSLEEG